MLDKELHLPPLFTDSNGSKVQHDVLNGRAKFLQYEREPGVWIYRQLISGSRKYLTGRLGIVPLADALVQVTDLSNTKRMAMDS